jgi:hypothetical protein
MKYHFTLFVAIILIVGGFAVYFSTPATPPLIMEVVDRYIDTTVPPQPAILNKNGKPGVYNIPVRDLKVWVKTNTTDTNLMKQVGQKLYAQFTTPQEGDTTIVQLTTFFFHPDSLKPLPEQQLQQVRVTQPAMLPVAMRYSIVEGGYVFSKLSTMALFVMGSQLQRASMPSEYFMKRGYALPSPGEYRFGLFNQDIKRIQEEQLRKSQPNK